MTKNERFIKNVTNVNDFDLFALIDVIRNLVFNLKTQLIEGYKQKWRISFY